MTCALACTRAEAVRTTSRQTLGTTCTVVQTAEAVAYSKVVLVVDDDEAVATVLAGLLKQDGYEAEAVASGPEALKRIDDLPPALVITDLRMPGMSGFELMQALQQRIPELPVAVITAYGNVEVAVDAMKRGAIDFLTKPFEREAVIALAKRYVGQRLEERDPCPEPASEWSSRAPIMKDCLANIERAARTTATVLIRGESGTGKERMAQAIHARSGRTGSFVPVHCAAIPESLLESELFGYEKGAFSGAQHHKPGRVELAEGGTLFLDEIGDVPRMVQVKLLRLLAEKTFEPLGGTSSRKADVRFVAATHRDLKSMTATGEFREDLYYRLAVLPIWVPRLSQRTEDIGDLAAHFLNQYRRESPFADLRLSSEAVDLLESMPWPGNVRQLQNLVERLAVFAEEPVVRAEHVRQALDRDRPSEEIEVLGDRGLGVAADADRTEDKLGETDIEARLRRTKVQAMCEAYTKAGHNWSRAARLLGISRRTLYNWKQELGILHCP